MMICRVYFITHINKKMSRLSFQGDKVCVCDSFVMFSVCNVLDDIA